MYNKLNNMDIKNYDFAMLMQCVKVNHTELHQFFVNYDTAWTHDGYTEWYPLPKTDLILLIFKHTNSDRVFTTIRRYTPEKWDYYKKSEGQDFKIVFTNSQSNEKEKEE